jgi:S-adenosylmethionine decarboxylase
MTHRRTDIPPDTALGRHLLLELYGCPAAVLKDGKQLEQDLRSAAEAMGATVVTSNFHQFSPYGISGVVIIKESHLTLHTWPEYGYAAVDIFTCGKIDLKRGLDYLSSALRAERREWAIHQRGHL